MNPAISRLRHFRKVSLMQILGMLSCMVCLAGCGSRPADKSILICADDHQIANIVDNVLPLASLNLNLDYQENGEKAKRDVEAIGNRGGIIPSGRPVSFSVSEKSGKILMTGSNFGSGKPSLTMAFFYIEEDKSSKKLYQAVSRQLSSLKIKIYDRSTLKENLC